MPHPVQGMSNEPRKKALAKQIRPGRAEAARAEIPGHLRNGDPRPVVGRSFPLVEAAEAHRAVEGRATTGKAVFIV